jgi:hypothetical protein
MPTPALALAPISRGAAAADTAESSTARQAGTVSKPAPAAGGGSPALDVLAAAELHRYTGSAVTLWGGRAAIAFRRGRWHAGADAGGATGDGEAALGTIAVKSADAGVSFGPHTRFGWLGAAADLRGALGWAWVAGRSPVSADIATGAGSGLTATAGVRLSLAAPIAGALQARAFVESGAVLRGVDGLSDGRSFAGVHDGYVTVGIGAGWTRD